MTYNKEREAQPGLRFELRSRWENNSRVGPSRKHRKLLMVCAVVLVAILAAAMIFQRKWPFTPGRLTRRLQQHSSATVEFGSFQELFFPRPGFIAENVVLRRDASSEPNVTVKRLTVLASYSGLVGASKSISRVQVDGLMVRLSSDNASQNLEFHRSSGKKENVTVVQLVADGATLEITTGEHKQRLTFPISRLRIDNLGENSESKFDVALQNPKPAMDIAARGKLGPWRTDQLLLTPVAGTFGVSHGLLGTVAAIDGTVTGAGQFKGHLGAIEVSGGAEVAGFEIRRAHHPMPLRVRFDSLVSTKPAEVRLRSVDAQLGDTEIKGAGLISPGKQSRDLVNLALTCDDGRIDDLLRLFVSSPKPAMSGPIQFLTSADLEHGDAPFLERVRLNGNFAIKNARFTSPKTQDKVNSLSARSQGNPKEENPPERHVSMLSGDVHMKDGVASLSNVDFELPGAQASGEGTFNVLNSRVQLQGHLRMRAELSEATRGVKSFFLKLVDPIFKKHNAGSEVPVYLTGTSQHPNVKVGLK